MSTLTSVVGMLPLVLFPGPGSELYRGLGSVVVGGLALSAVLTWAIIPPLLSIFFGLRAPRPSVAAAEAAEAAISDDTAEPEARPAVRAIAGGAPSPEPEVDAVADHTVVTWPRDGRA